MIDCRNTYDQSTGNFVTLATGVTALTYTTSVVLTSGRTYQFKVESRNSVRLLSLVCCSVCSCSSDPRSANSSNYCVQRPLCHYQLAHSFRWLNFYYWLQHLDPETGRHLCSRYYNCDGSTSTVITAAACTIPVGSLVAAPYYIAWGSPVYA